MLKYILKKYCYGICYCACFLLSITSVLAGDPIYPAATIAESLKPNAHVVKRLEEVNVKINSAKDVRVTEHYVLTILDPEGARYAGVSEWYSKLQEVRSIKGTLYNSLGLPVKKLKQSDIQDLSGVDRGSLMTDFRYKQHAFYYNLYPYTVEYEIEVKYNHSFFLPSWTPQRTGTYAVEQSKMVVTAPRDYVLRYHHINYEGDPVVNEEGDNKTYTWQVKNLPAATNEAYAPRWYKRTTTVLLAPSVFEMQDYKGAMNNWEEFGRFMYILNQGRDQLPETIKQTVHQLTDGLSREEKIAKLYKYLQENTRYISIQLGIGGWQTFDANYVATKGYGDCKALSNYMCALLKEAGIKASTVLVYAGDDSKDYTEELFPANRFNHMIVCVPGTKDTTWLECTSNSHPVGYLGAFTADRPVLIVDETGSKLVRTPAYSMEMNQQIRHIDAIIDESGDMLMKADTRRTCLQQDDLHSIINSLTREKQLEYQRNAGCFSSYDVIAYDCKQIRESFPIIDEHLEISARNYATPTGKRIFLEPNLLNKGGRRLAADTTRQSSIYLENAYRNIDTVVIRIPEGYTPEVVFQPMVAESIFGRYSSNVKVEGSTITYIRSMEQKSGTYPASAYPELAKFYNEIFKADRARLVLVKK